MGLKSKIKGLYHKREDIFSGESELTGELAVQVGYAELKDTKKIFDIAYASGINLGDAGHGIDYISQVITFKKNDDLIAVALPTERGSRRIAVHPNYPEKKTSQAFCTLLNCL